MKAYRCSCERCPAAAASSTVVGGATCPANTMFRRRASAAITRYASAEIPLCTLMKSAPDVATAVTAVTALAESRTT